jgi:hypothetical protein
MKKTGGQKSHDAVSLTNQNFKTVRKNLMREKVITKAGAEKLEMIQSCTKIDWIGNTATTSLIFCFLGENR